MYFCLAPFAANGVTEEAFNLNATPPHSLFRSSFEVLFETAWPRPPRLKIGGADRLTLDTVHV